VDRPVLDRLLVVALLIVYVQALTIGIPVKELLMSGSYCSLAVAVRGSSNTGSERVEFGRPVQFTVYFSLDFDSIFPNI
jgi:hypothetical protein